MKKQNNPARDLVYNYLRDRMYQGELLPGSSLDLKKVSEELEISRTPLRDALIRLEAEGLVTIFPRSKVIVNKLEMEDIEYLFEVAGALEGTIIVRGMQNFTDEILDGMDKTVAKMRDCINRGDIHEYDDLHRELHMTFLSMAPNKFAERILVPIQDRLWDMPRRNFSNEWFLLSCDEHDQITQALRDKDEEALLHYVKEVHWGYHANEKYIQSTYFNKK